MAEVKNAFIKSKMNKDLDSRLLPSGEYRDGQNIQVSKSEGEDVGALENAVGNLPATTSTGASVDFSVISGLNSGTLKSIGIYTDTNTSIVYVFLTDYTEPETGNITYSSTANNYIYAYHVLTSNVSLVAKGSFLNFSKTNPIYGINILENLLFWTDNRNQPRKLNVVLATKNNGLYYSSEDLISVAKYNPYQPIDLYYNGGAAFFTSMQDVTSEFLPDGSTLNPFYNKPLGVTTPAGETWPGDPDYLEDKFVTFSYRFKFNDGEYSIMAPFTQEAFIPKQDGYFLQGDEDAAYRSTVVRFMENKVNSVGLYIKLPFAANDLNSTLDVSEIDILYKESDSLAVKVLDSVPFNVFSLNADETSNSTKTYLYDYQSRKPYKTLAESEIIRVYDKVPVRAFGQEVIGNRIVYSNFQDKHSPPPSINYDVAVTPKNNIDESKGFTSIVEYPEHTVKQNRNYQVGFVLSDRYGRQSTTVLSPVNSVTQTVDGITYGGSTFFHPYTKDPGLGNNDVNDWPGDSLKVLINTPGIINETPRLLDGWPGLHNGDSNSADYNPLGWYSYKIVVKQTEQEYYNVYLPGILDGYPDFTVNATPPAPDPVDTIAHITLLGDNINKVPRNLTEVGPEQKQYGSEVELYGRVTPERAGPPNFTKPYYPQQNSQTVVTISEQDNLFADANAAAPYATVYQSDSNPYIARLSQGDVSSAVGSTLPKPIGSLQVNNLSSVYGIFLGVFETAPVESLLEIFWETSSTGLISDLNAIAGVNDTVSGFSNFVFNQTEATTDYVTAGAFSPTTTVNLVEVPITNSTVRLLNVIDGTGVPRKNMYTNNQGDLEKIQVAGQPDAWKIPVLDPSYYSTEAAENTFTFSFEVRDDDATNPRFQTKSVTNLNLGNKSPELLPLNNPGSTPISVPSTRIRDNKIATFTGQNGFAGSTTFGSTAINEDLSFTIKSGSQSPSSPPLELNPDTGELFEKSGLAFGVYVFDLILTDSGGASDAQETSISVLFGEEPINDSFGKKENIDLTGGLESVGVYWAAATNYSNMIGSTPLPAGMENNNNISQGRSTSFTTPLSLDGLNASITPGVSSSTGTSDLNYFDNNSNSYTWSDFNYRPDAFDSNAGSSGNSLTKGTAYIKVDFSFEMPTFDATNSAYPLSYGQIGVVRAVYLQYRANESSSWTTARDVEGQLIKFGSTQQNIGGTPSGANKPGLTQFLTEEQLNALPSTFSATGILNDSAKSVKNITGSAISDTDMMRATTTYPAAANQIPTKSTVSKVFVFGKDESYGGNDALGEYRLLIRYPQTDTDQKKKNPSYSNQSLDITPIGTSGLNGTTVFGNQGALFVANNIKIKLSFGDFYYKGNERVFAYRVSNNGKTNAGYAKTQTPDAIVYAREWALRYVTQFYTTSDLTVKWTPNVADGWYSYRANELTNPAVQDGTENASIKQWISNISPPDVTVGDLSGGTSLTADRFFVAKFDATGKKIIATAEPATGNIA